MAGHGDAHVEAALLGQSVGDLVGDGRVLGVLLLLAVVLLGELRVLAGDRALGHGEDGEAAAAVVALADLGGDLVDVVRDLGDQDDVSAAGHARVERQPADLVAHDLHDEHAAVRGGGGVDAVDGVGGDVHGALEAKGHVRAPEVVVDRLGQGDDVQALLAQQVGRLVGAVAAQDDQAVELQFVIVLLHRRDLVQTVLVRLADSLVGRAAAAQERAAFGQYAGEVRIAEQAEPPVDQALIAVEKAVDLHVLAGIVHRLGHAAHRRVQRLAIAAAGQHTDSNHTSTSFWSRRDGGRAPSPKINKNNGFVLHYNPFLVEKQVYLIWILQNLKNFHERIKDFPLKMPFHLI